MCERCAKIWGYSGHLPCERREGWKELAQAVLEPTQESSSQLDKGQERVKDRYQQILVGSEGKSNW